jgi:hypothetical protein
MGILSQDANSWRIGIEYSASIGLSGGHLEDHGLTADRTLVDSPLHRHEVEIDIHRVEMSLSRTFSSDIDVQFRLPWFVKNQDADITFIEPATAEQIENARRNGAIHHRSETYEGFGDAEFTIGWRTYDLFTEQDTLRVSLGMALPTGATESDPWVLGERGTEHLHILFGNGTFDPLVDLYYAVPLGDKWAASLFAKARLPFYENSKGYRGSTEFILSPRLDFRPTPRLSFAIGATASYLGRSRWARTGTDPNSGAFITYASCNAGYLIGQSVTAGVSLQMPLHTELFGEEDGLDAAPTVGISLSRQF